MECKEQSAKAIFPWRKAIKVEPYWNVKPKQTPPPAPADSIKVEPYWNVKRIEAFMEAVESELK